MCLFSFVIYSMFLYLLQNTISIHGIVLATICSVGFFSVPMFLESARLVVSQVFHSHIDPLTQLQRNQAAIMVAAASAINDPSAVEHPLHSLPLQNVEADLLNSEQFKEQKMLEYSSGAAYWTAFSGAYGVVIGSILLNIYTKKS